MRNLCVAALAVGAVGCTSEPDRVAPIDLYQSLEARVEIDCGLYEKNYTPEEAPFPLHLCGEAPDIACINDAIDGKKIARLTYRYREPNQGDLREHNYYAGDGKLTWIGFYEQSMKDMIPASWWHTATCGHLDEDSYDVLGMTCWNITNVGCVSNL